MKLFCPSCEIENAVDFVREYKHNNNLFANKKLYKCRDCGLIFIDPMPGSSELDAYYKNVWLKDEAISSTAEEAEIIYQVQADERLKYLARHVNLHDGMKVLDIGAGYGYLCGAFKKRGLTSIDFYATDPCPSNLDKLKIKGAKSFSELGEIKEKDFDVAFVCSVLEHVNNPARFLRSISGHLKAGGHIFIDLPERDDTFKPIHEPHVAVYSAESLTNLASKLELKIIHMAGYGRQRYRLIADLNRNNNVLAFIYSKFIGAIDRIESRMFPGAETKGGGKPHKYSQYYKFSQEGKNRWWLRAIIRKDPNPVI